MATQFAPTKEMISAANAVFMAKAAVQTIQPIVEKYERDILAKHQFKNLYDKEVFEKVGRTYVEEIITNPKHAYRMAKADFAIYDAECKAAAIIAGLKVENPDNCPLLVAKSLEREAKRLLVDAMEPVTKMNTTLILSSKNGVENMEKMVELSLKLLAAYAKENPTI